MSKIWLICVCYIVAAGNAFGEAAKVQLNHLQVKHDAASQYVEAANCYRKADFQGKCWNYIT